MTVAIRSAAALHGQLSSAELARYRARDALLRRVVSSPAAGVVVGISASGALRIETSAGVEEHRAGTIRLAEDA
jgi:hypothetical protein